MKKLLTLLLTIIMAICLINIRSNVAKSESDYGYTYYGNGMWSSGAETSYLKGDQITLINASEDPVTITLPGGATVIIKEDDRLSHTFTVDGGTLSLGDDTATIVDSKCVYYIHEDSGWNPSSSTTHDAGGQIILINESYKPVIATLPGNANIRINYRNKYEYKFVSATNSITLDTGAITITDDKVFTYVRDDNKWSPTPKNQYEVGETINIINKCSQKDVGITLPYIDIEDLKPDENYLYTFDKAGTIEFNGYDAKISIIEGMTYTYTNEGWSRGPKEKGYYKGDKINLVNKASNPISLKLQDVSGREITTTITTDGTYSYSFFCSHSSPGTLDLSSDGPKITDPGIYNYNYDTQGWHYCGSDPFKYASGSQVALMNNSTSPITLNLPGNNASTTIPANSTYLYKFTSASNQLFLNGTTVTITDTGVYHYIYDGTNWSPSSPETSYASGNKIVLVNNSTSPITLNLPGNNALTTIPASGGTYSYIFNSDTGSLSYSGTTATITDTGVYHYIYSDGAGWSPSSPETSYASGNKIVLINNSAATVAITLPDETATYIGSEKEYEYTYSFAGGTLDLSGGNSVVIDEDTLIKDGSTFNNIVKGMITNNNAVLLQMVDVDSETFENNKSEGTDLSNSGNKSIYGIVNFDAEFGQNVLYIYIKKGTRLKFNNDSSHMFENITIPIKFKRGNDPSTIDTSIVTNMSYMFNNCGIDNNLVLSDFDTSKVTKMSYMFSGTGIYNISFGNKFDTSNVTDMSYMFSGCENLSALELPYEFILKSLKNAEGMFKDCTTLRQIIFDNHDLQSQSLENMKDMFSGCSTLESLRYSYPLGAIVNLSMFDTSKVMNMSGMFEGCSKINNIAFKDSEKESLDESPNFVTNSVTDMSNMFKGCKFLTTIDISGFNSAALTNTSGMFEGCTLLENIELFVKGKTNFSLSKVTNMSNMFKDTSIRSLDLSGVSTDKLTGYNSSSAGMFSGCKRLIRIYATNKLSFTNVESSADMFKDCEKLTGGNDTTFDKTKTDKEYAVIDDIENNGYFTDNNKRKSVSDGVVCNTTGPCKLNGNNVDGISYDSTNKVVTINGLSLDININDSFKVPLTLPKDIKEIVIKGNNIINAKFNADELVIKSDDGSIFNNVKFTGDGTLYLNNIDGGDCFKAKNMTVDGPTLVMSTNANEDYTDLTSVLHVTNNLTVNKGSIDLFGGLGLWLGENFTNSKPSLVVNGDGKIISEGVFAAFMEVSDSLVEPNAKVEGRSIKYKTTTTNLMLFGSDSMYYYLDTRDPDYETWETAVLLEFTKANPVTPTPEPSPSPSPSKKDESCEKVIGPTWHWNNTKGICEDIGVVGTYTR